MGQKRDNKIERSPGIGDYDVENSLNITKPAIRGGPYIKEKDDFEEHNAWQYQNSISNPYVKKPKTPKVQKSYMASTLTKARKEIG